MSKLNSALVKVAGTLLGLMALLVAIGAIMRYIFHMPITWSIEIPGLLFLPAITLGLAYTQMHRGHVGMDLFVTRLPPKARMVFDILALILFLMFGLFLVWVGWSRMLEDLQYGVRSSIARVPVSVIELFLPVGLVFLCVQIVLQIVRNVSDIARWKQDDKKGMSLPRKNGVD